MAGGIDAPFLDAATLYGTTFSTPPGIYAPHLASGIGFGATVGAPSTDGLIVKVGNTVLTGAFARSWRDVGSGRGAWSFSLANDDPDMPDFDDLVTFVENGKIRFAGPVRGKRTATFTPAEEIDEVTELSGPDRLGITGKSVIGPSRGWDAVPVEVTRSQAWMSHDFDASGWPRMKRIRRVDTTTPYFPHRAIPEWYPDKNAWEVAPNRSDITGSDAPVGRWPCRSDAIALDEGTIEVVCGLNNLGQVYFDGALIADIQNAPPEATRIRFDVSADDHFLSGLVSNFIRDTWFVASIYTVDSDGLLDELVWSSDANNMRALAYPPTVPSTNAGKALRQYRDWIQDNEGELLDLELDFNDHVDSAGNPWDHVAEITTEVGRTYEEYVEALSGWLIDAQMAPGANRLRAWNWGTRGRISGATIAATTNRNTSDVEGLIFDGRHVRHNRLRIRYKRGYTFVDESGPAATVTGFLDLSHIDDEATAQTMGCRELQLRKDASYAGALTLSPASPQPYDDFDNGDYVGHPPNPAGDTSSRVRSINRREDKNGEPFWDLELHDIRQETEERLENWLKRSDMGTLAGGAKVTSRSGDAIAPAQKVSAKTVAETSFQDPSVGEISGKRPAESSGNLIEIHVEVSTEDDVPTASATVVEVFQNGVSLGTVTVPAGATSAELDLEATKVYRNVDRFRAKVVTVGGDVNGVDVQVRAI